MPPHDPPPYLAKFYEALERASYGRWCIVRAAMEGCAAGQILQESAWTTAAIRRAI